MANFLEALGLSSVSTVGISVSASNVIEMICIDKSQRMIMKYACKELKYNNAIREIISYEDFAQAIQDLFKEINVTPKNSNVVLNIPNVHFSFSSLPLVLPDEQIATAIASEVEEMYLFKRHEPVVSWNTVNVNKETEIRYIVYGAIQENAIQNIKDIFEELGAKLVAVETSNSSMIKGIIYSRVLEEEFIGNDTTNILLIGSNSYSIFCMQGKKLVDYFEEPLAIKSFSSDEVYVAISSAAGTALENYPAKNLLVVSETNDVSAEILCHKINFEGNLKYLDRNMYADKSFMEISPTVLTKYSPMISLEAVGAAAYTYETFPIKFNFLLGEDSEVSQMLTLHMFDQDYEIDRRAVLNISTILGVLILGLLMLLCLGLSVLEKRLLSEIATMQDQSVEAQTKINATNIGGDVNNIYNVSKQISDENEKDLALIYSLGTEIPSDVYLTSFYCNSNSEVRIIGKATASESIYAYVKGLKTKYAGLKISRLNLDAVGEDSSSATYTFVIESEAAAKQTEANAAAAAKADASGKNPAAPAAAPAAGAAKPVPAQPANAPGGLPAPVSP